MSLVFCIVILSGNLLIIIAVIVDPLKKLRTPFSYFLVNLAVSDLVVGAVTMPVSYVVHQDEVTLFIPNYKVKLLHISYFIAATGSVLSLGALSLDRYVAIRWPIRYRRRLSMLRCFAISIVIWLFSGSVSLIYLKTGYIDFLMVFAHISVVTTLVLLVVTYRQVYKAFRTQANELRALQRTTPNPQNEDWRKARNEKKVTRAFLYILGLFVCCYVPAIVMIYILQFCTQCSCDARHVLRDAQFLLVSVNSAMNPFVCTIRLGPFRRSIIALFWRRRKQEVTYAPKDRAVYIHGRDNEGVNEVTVASSTNTDSFQAH